MKLYWEYVWYGGNEYYKMLCMEGKHNDWELIKFKINSNRYMSRT